MGRYNGKFKYASAAVSTERDPSTVFLVSPVESVNWCDGTHCQIDKQTPPKQHLGEDGHVEYYRYNVYLNDSRFRGKIAIGTRLLLLFEDGTTDEITVQSIDETRKYIELWG